MQKRFFLKALVGAAFLVGATAGAYAQDALARVKAAEFAQGRYGDGLRAVRLHRRRHA